MKVYFTKVDETNSAVAEWDNNRVHFQAAKNIIVQPSEIMKVPTNVIIQVEGNAVLNIITHSQISERAGELFPAFKAIDSTSETVPLILPIRNNGRNPLTIFTGQPLATGYVYIAETLEGELKDFSIALEKDLPKSRPQKKNPDFKFELT